MGAGLKGFHLKKIKVRNYPDFYRPLMQPKIIYESNVQHFLISNSEITI